MQIGDTSDYHYKVAILKRRVAELEEENERLQTLTKALEAAKDPEQVRIPFDKVKADLRIAELEEALKEIMHSTARSACDSGGCEDAYNEAKAALEKGNG